MADPSQAPGKEGEDEGEVEPLLGGGKGSEGGSSGASGSSGEKTSSSDASNTFRSPMDRFRAALKRTRYDAAHKQHETEKWRRFAFEWLPCLVYVVLYVVLDILVSSQGHEHPITGRRIYDYYPGVLILLAEAGKLMISLVILTTVGTAGAAPAKQQQQQPEDKDKKENVVYDADYGDKQNAAEAQNAKEDGAETEDAESESDAGGSQHEARGGRRGSDRCCSCFHRCWDGFMHHLEQGIWFSVPAALYTLWNVLNYQSLLFVPLSSYSIVYQSVVFFNALLWSVTFGRPIRTIQWLALILLAVGVFLVNLKPNFKWEPFEVTALWVLAQAFVSAFAGVANEFLYKQKTKRGVDININLQNTYLYSFTTIFTMLFLIYSAGPQVFTRDNFFKGFNGVVVCIVITTVFLGLSVAMILKHRDIIVKLFAQSIHSPIEVVAAHFILHTDLSWFIGLASFLIAVSTYLYYRPPPGPEEVYEKFEKIYDPYAELSGDEEDSLQVPAEGGEVVGPSMPSSSANGKTKRKKHRKPHLPTLHSNKTPRLER